MFKFGDGDLSVVNGQEGNKLLEINYFLISDFYSGLQSQDVALNFGLRFEDRLQSFLSSRKLVQLSLVVSLLLLCLELELLDSLSALEAIIHA